MNEILVDLNANSGAIVALTATVSAILTILLLLEARATRNLGRVARLEARAKAHPAASFLLELNVHNYGPATARNVVINQRLVKPDGEPAGSSRRQGEVLLAAGEGRRFLPMMENNSSMLVEMGKQDLTLHVDWSWEDDRRRLWFFPLRHKESRDWSTATLATDFFGGWALTEIDTPNDIHEMREALKHIEADAKKIDGYLRSIAGSMKE